MRTTRGGSARRRTSGDRGRAGRGLALVLAGLAAGAGCGDDGRPPAVRRGQITGSLAVFTPGAARAPRSGTVIDPGPIQAALRRRLAAAERSTGRDRAGLGRGEAPVASALTSLLASPPAFTVASPIAFPVETGPFLPPRALVPGRVAFPLPGSSPEGNTFVPGEVLITFRESGLEAIPRLAEVPGLEGYDFTLGVHGGPDVATVRFHDRSEPERQVGPRETLWIRDRLGPHPALARVELNHWRWALAEPNDEIYGAQWHYPQINLPAAWDLTTGSADVVVAVIDDGVNPHPDLTRRLDGYDMISDLQIAGDGDGRDPRAEQVPLSHGTSSVWHGTHVAGTVGASTDNGVGVAGVDWQARLLPVRVLGRVIPGAGQGTTVDIIAGINWAAGIDVPGVPPNPTPAQVLNLSLGGGPLVQAEQDAIDAAVARGAVVVVAAGNSNQDASTTSLAGYDNVVVVGAVDYEGRRAPYSNFGAVVDVMAPGGHVGADANADGRPDGVLSTYLDADGQEPNLTFLEGTSMAAPHVAGVCALMKAVRPSITPAEIEQILKATASPASQCPEGCGAGLVNAAAALLQAQGGADPNRPPTLALGSERLNLGDRDGGTLQVFNAGGGTLAWEARLEGTNAGALRLVGSTAGTLSAKAADAIEVAVDRAGLTDGAYQAVLVVEGGGATRRAAVIFRVGAVEVQDVGEVIVGAVGFDDAGEVVVAGAAATDRASGYRFVIDAEPGSWLIIALADRNGNEELDAGDFWGLHESLDAPESVEVTLSSEIQLPVFDLVPFTDDVAAAPPPCTAYRACIEGCAGNPLCAADCEVTPACEACFVDEVQACGAQNGCAGDDLACLCGACEPSLDACFGPLLCAGGGGGTMPPPGAPVGSACADAPTTCVAPYMCDTSVAGGYCSRSCFQDGSCPGGVCVELDLDEDGFVDEALCFATCVGPGTCPRPLDACLDLDGVGVCLPE